MILRNVLQHWMKDLSQTGERMTEDLQQIALLNMSKLNLIF